MGRIPKIVLKVIGSILALILVLWLGLALYVHTHKKELLQTITTQLNDNLNGKLTIESIEPALIRGFPGISVSMKNVLLRDSLWEQHRHDLLKAKEVFIAVNAFSILSGSPTIKNIRVENGQLYLFKDSLGRRNSDLFRKKTDTAKSGNSKNRINRVILDNVALTIEDQLKNKLYRFNINRFDGKINYTAKGWKSEVGMQVNVNDLSFNRVRGSFLKNKLIATKLDLEYNEEDHVLSFPLQDMQIGDDDFMIGGIFAFAPDNSDFVLDIKAEKIPLQNAIKLLTPHIESKIKPYQLEKPLSVRAMIKGSLQVPGEPLISVSWHTVNNTLHAAGETFTNCSFTGKFTNQYNKSLERDDPNSALSFYKIDGRYMDIPFHSDSVQILDLKRPVFTGHFKSDFPLAKLNPVLGGNTFKFDQGQVNLNLVYKAPFNQNNVGQRYIYGKIQVSNGAANYNPRNLGFKNIQMVMNFNGNDLLVQNMKVQSASSSLTMSGILRNFSNFYYTDPEKILIDWQIQSPQVNLNEFMVFLARRKSAPSAQDSRNSMTRMSRQLEKMLEQGSVRVNLAVNKVIFKKFEATDVRSTLFLNQSGIAVNNVSLKHGGGSLKMDGRINQGGAANRFTVNTQINNVNVQTLFRSFGNFGQDAITDLNLRGNFYGTANVGGTMKENGEVLPRSMRGKVSFDIRNGALVGFEPMEKIGSFAFPRRDFSNITFTNLKNTFDINGEKIYIPPMEIRSSVLNIFLDGTYSFTTGTDIAIKIPLRNPEKDKEILDKNERKTRELKGIVINVRAVDGDNGKVRFKLGKRPENFETNANE